MLERIIFLDRDGVINKLVERDGRMVSPRRYTDFELLPNVQLAINKLREYKFKIIVVTNQPDISRGLMEINELDQMHEVVHSLWVDEIKVCIHTDDDNCLCRKPKPGMITDYLTAMGHENFCAWIVGDDYRDLEAGYRAGIPGFLISNSPKSPKYESAGHAIDLSGAVDQIIELIGQQGS